MDNWSIKIYDNFAPSKPVFIEGLPGIGNVGKIAVDYISDFLEAKKVAEFFSFKMPAHVFIDEDNLVIPPSLSLFHKLIDGVDYLFLQGEYQPSSDEASFEFVDLLLKTLNKWGCKDIIATGGIGLTSLPDDPVVFVTGSSKEYCDTFTKVGANENVFGLVGPIIGVSGLLVGLGKQKNIPSAALLVETFVHPSHFGLKESKVLATLLCERFGFTVDFLELDKEIELFDDDLYSDNDEAITLDRNSSKYKKLMKGKDLNYIG